MVMVATQDAEFKPAPIPKSWVTEGAPHARNALLAVSADKTALTLLWDCTGGSFRWIYDQDETIHVLEGSVTLTLKGKRVEQLGPGSIVFFPAGSVAHWQVHGYVRKLAVFREAIPSPMAFAVRARAKVRGLMRRERPRLAGPGVGPALQPA